MELIKIRGARTHNLKNINLDIPRNKLVVITGLSGSGKSSLAFDTLYAEGQRRYVESLSAYARQFLQLMEKPDVDLIEGLSPAIAIEQKATSHNPRSTVGTVTEIHDYLRLLYARVGDPFCPEHGIKLSAQSVSQMVDHVLRLPADTKLMVLAPSVVGRKGEQQDLFDELRAQGFTRIRLDGSIYEIDQLPKLTKNKKHTIEVPPGFALAQCTAQAALHHAVGHRHQASRRGAAVDGFHGRLVQYARVLPWRQARPVARRQAGVHRARLRGAAGAAGPGAPGGFGTAAAGGFRRAVRRAAGRTLVLLRAGAASAEPVLPGGQLKREGPGLNPSMHRARTMVVSLGLSRQGATQGPPA